VTDATVVAGALDYSRPQFKLYAGIPAGTFQTNSNINTDEATVGKL
jgi:hypothetical protein